MRLAFAGGVSRSTWCLAVYAVRSCLLRAVSRRSAGRVGADGRCSTGYVESSESRSHHQDGGGVEPPQRNLGGNTRKGVRRWEKPTRECDCVYEQQRNMSKSSSSSDGLLSQHSHICPPPSCVHPRTQKEAVSKERTILKGKMRKKGGTSGVPKIRY